MHANQECTRKSYWCHPTDQQARWVHFQQEWWKSVWGIDSKKKPFVFFKTCWGNTFQAGWETQCLGSCKRRDVFLRLKHRIHLIGKCQGFSLQDTDMIWNAAEIGKFCSTNLINFLDQNLHSSPLEFKNTDDKF